MRPEYGSYEDIISKGISAVSISQDDWSLNRKGPVDEERHKEKVKEAVKGDLQNIIADESIITTDGKKIVRIPIRSLKDHSFNYAPNAQPGTGAGQGKVGDLLGEDGKKGQGPGKGPGPAGEEAGIDYYDAEISLAELTQWMMEDLNLPWLEPKKNQEIESSQVDFTDITKKGPMGNLNKKRTVMANIKRNAKNGDPHFHDLSKDDMRFNFPETRRMKSSNAVVIAMMDVSGSMGDFEKYMARSFYFWMVRFLRSKYNNVAIRFISHHTEAKECTEDEFFNKGESGGTQVSSAYGLALEMIQKDYPKDSWNIYPFHFSDGDNIPWDNTTCIDLVNKIMGLANLFGYGEIREPYRGVSSQLMEEYKKGIHNPHFISTILAGKQDVYPALKKFFSADPTLNREGDNTSV